MVISILLNAKFSTVEVEMWHDDIRTVVKAYVRKVRSLE